MDTCRESRGHGRFGRTVTARIALRAWPPPPPSSTPSSPSASAGGSSTRAARSTAAPASAWDYGPLGVELKENIKRQWWRSMVHGPRGRRRARLLGHPARARSGWPRGHVGDVHRPADRVPVAATSASAPTTCRRTYEEKKGTSDPDRSAWPTSPAPTAAPAAVDRAARVQQDAQDLPRLDRGRVRPALPAARDRAGHLHQLPQRHDQASRKKPPFGIAQIGKSFRNEITPGQLHLPHPRVRADGDGVLRQARRGRGVAPVLDRRAHRAGTPTSASTPTTCGTTSTRRRSCRTTPSAPSTSSTASTSPAASGASSRASPTAPTSTSRPTRSTPAPTWSTSTRPAGERYTPYVIEPAAGLTRAA